MGTLTLAQTLTDVCGELGVNAPSNFVGNADLSAKQFVAIAQTSGDLLLAEFNWQALITKYTFATVNGTEAYALPADFDSFIDETQWNLSSRWPVQGPRSQRDWAQVEGFTVNIGPYFAQQLRGAQLLLQPIPTSAQTIFYYYLSKNWITNAGPTQSIDASRLDNDLNLTVYPDNLLKMAVKYRWLRAKRMSYDEEYEDYTDALQDAITSDRGARTVSLDPGGYNQQWGTGIVVPVTGFGG
jgi:hypothetical protein